MMTLLEKVMMVTRAARPTGDEAMAFMITALVRMEADKPGTASQFYIDLADLRKQNRKPNGAEWMK